MFMLPSKAVIHGSIWCAVDAPGGLLASACVKAGAISYRWTIHGGMIVSGKGTNQVFFEGFGGWTTAVVTITDNTGTWTEYCDIYLEEGSGLPGKSSVDRRPQVLTVQKALSILAEVKEDDYNVAFDGIDLMQALADGNLCRRQVFSVIDDSNVVTLVLVGETQDQDHGVDPQR